MREISPEKRLNQLTELISTGISFADAIESLAPVTEAETRLLQRASFVRAFDRDLFEAVLSIRGPSFDEVVRLPGIERTSDTVETYRVKDSVAAEYLQSWVAKNPGEIREFSDAVYRYVANLPGYDEIDVLRFRIPVQPAEALEDFDRLFTAADHNFDLGRCHALVQMLRELDNFQVGRWSAPLRLLSPELRSRCDDATPYITARGRFIEEFAKSASYLERDELKARTLAFLQPSGDWVLPVFGAGGRGKTIFLQWLTARHCVPQPHRIPVAKVDFDDINIAKLGRYPYLLLLRFAEQIDRQIFGSPFSDLLQRHGKFASILLPSARLPHGRSIDGLESDLQSLPGLGRELQETFAIKLSGRLVLAILDTVEEGVLHFPESLRAAIEILRGIHDQSPGFKVLMAGRYDLAERGFLQKADPASFEVQPFTADEASRYLLASRRLEQRDLVPAILGKARGNPFILALIADLVVKGDVRTVADVEELPPEFAYLIRRVIDRIPDSQYGVRWVIRYGVIPRRLTLDFLQYVMAPELREELAAAEGRLDKVKVYKSSFPRGGPIEVATLWSELRQYAAPNGWLRSTGEDVRFQPEVVKPMRALLVQEEVHNVLHQRARDWFAGKAEAESDPRRWADWMAEALYHLFWLRAGDAVDRWRACLADGRAAAGGGRRTLLEVVTGFVEAEGDEREPQLEPRVRGVLPPETVGWALVEWAKSAAGIAFGPCRIEESPANIRRTLRLGHVLYPEGEWPAALENLIEIALAIEQRTYQRAQGLGQAISQEFQTADAVYAYSILMARALAGVGDEMAEAQYYAAHDLLRRHGEEAYSGWEILAECARALAALGKADRALVAYQRAVEDAGAGAVQLAVEAAELYLQTGACAEALRLVEGGAAPSLSQVRIRVLASIAQGRLERARDAWAGEQPRNPGSPLEPALELETRGALSAAWYHLNPAVEDLEQAFTLFRRVGDAQRAESVLLTLVRILKDQNGDWRRAERLLNGAGLDSPALALELAHLQTLQGREPGVAPDTEGVGLFLAVERGEAPRPALRRFVEEIQQVLPISARYGRLRAFHLLDPIDGVADMVPLFLDAVPMPSPSSSDFFTRVFYSIEMLRCLKSPAAADLLRQATARQQEEDFVLHRIIRAAAKLGTGLPSVELVEAFLAAAGYDPLGAATVIEYVSVLIHRDEASAAQHLVGEPLPAALQGTLLEAKHLSNRAHFLSAEDPRRSELLHSAVGILRVLGQEAFARRLMARASGPLATKAVPASAVDKDRVVFALSSLPDPWDVPPGRAVSFEHVKALSGTQSEVVRALREALPDLAAKPVVELDIDDAPLVALPWEWAFSSDVICYRSSRFLSPIGAKLSPLRFLWSKTPERLRHLLSYALPVRVVILKQPAAYQERLQRGFEVVSRRPLSVIYQSHGVRAFEPDFLNTSGIAKAIAEHEPRVIHIQAPVLEEEGTLVLDLPLLSPALSGEMERQRLTVDLLSQLFRSSLRTRNAPLLILDSPRPLDTSEVARQLLLRNRFAADFVALGQARAVLCTGLFERSRMELVAERLALGISLTPRLQELLVLCRREGDDCFSGPGTALFAADPEGFLR